MCYVESRVNVLVWSMQISNPGTSNKNQNEGDEIRRVDKVCIC